MRFTLLLLLSSSLFCQAGEWLHSIQEKAAAFASIRKWDEASRVYQEALSDAGSGDRFSLHVAIAEMRFNMGDYPGARRWLQTAGVPPGPEEQSQFSIARGVLHLVDGNLSAARKELVRAVEHGPSPAGLHVLASLEAQTGELVEAESHQREALALWQKSLGNSHEYVRRAWISLSTIQGLRQRWDLAEQSLQNALRIAETPEALQNYATVLDHCKRHREAKAIRSRLPPVASPTPLIDIHALRVARENTHRVMVR